MDGLENAPEEDCLFLKKTLSSACTYNPEKMQITINVTMSSEQCVSQNSVCHLAEHIKEGFPHFSDHFSDVKVLALGEEYHFQKFIPSQTPFFRSLLSRSWIGNRIYPLRRSKCYKVHLFFRFRHRLVSIEIRDAKLYLIC